MKTKISYPFTSKKQIVARLGEDLEFIRESLLVLWRAQTAHERETKTTLHRNARGFMSSHAVTGCKLAEKAVRGEEWTPEDWQKAQSITLRYGRQLAAFHREVALEERPELAEVAAVFGV